MYKKKGILIINHQSTFIKNQLFTLFGNYDLRFQFAADNHLLNKVIKKYGFKSFEYIDFPIALFEKNGVTSDIKNYFKILKEFITIAREVNNAYFKSNLIGISGVLKLVISSLKNESVFR